MILNFWSGSGSGSSFRFTIQPDTDPQPCLRWHTFYKGCPELFPIPIGAGFSLSAHRGQAFFRSLAVPISELTMPFRDQKLWQNDICLICM
jgi:hypothetical protein